MEVDHTTKRLAYHSTFLKSIYTDQTLACDCSVDIYVVLTILLTNINLFHLQSLESRQDKSNILHKSAKILPTGRPVNVT